MNLAFWVLVFGIGLVGSPGVAVAQTPDYYEVAPAGCSAPIVWGVFPDSKKVRFATHPAMSGAEVAAVEAGVEAWDHAKVGFTVFDEGSQFFDDKDSIVHFMMVPKSSPQFGSSTSVATNRVVRHPSGCYIIWSDVYINEDMNFFLGSDHRNMGDDEYELTQVVTHETGHALGFGNVGLHPSADGTVMLAETPPVNTGDLRGTTGAIGGIDLAELQRRQQYLGYQVDDVPTNLALSRMTPLTGGDSQEFIWVEPLDPDVNYTSPPVWGGKCPGDVVVGDDRPLGIQAHLMDNFGASYTPRIDWYFTNSVNSCGTNPNMRVGTTQVTLSGAGPVVSDVYPDTWRVPLAAGYMQSYYLCAVINEDQAVSDNNSVDDVITSVAQYMTCPAP